MLDRNFIYSILAEGYLGNQIIPARNTVKNYIKRELWIPLIHWGVRAIYIKLFLEWKIDEEDLKQLVQSKDVDIDLESMTPENIRNPYANTNYVFINNLW